MFFKSIYGFGFDLDMLNWVHTPNSTKKTLIDFQCLEKFHSINNDKSFRIEYNGTIKNNNNLNNLFDYHRDYLLSKGKIMRQSIVQTNNGKIYSKFLFKDEGGNLQWLYCLQLNESNAMGAIIMDTCNPEASEEFLDNIINTWQHINN